MESRREETGWLQAMVTGDGGHGNTVPTGRLRNIPGRRGWGMGVGEDTPLGFAVPLSMAFWWTKYDEAGNHMGLHLLRQTSRESSLVISFMRRSATTISVMKHGDSKTSMSASPFAKLSAYNQCA